MDRLPFSLTQKLGNKLVIDSLIEKSIFSIKKICESVAIILLNPFRSESVAIHF